MSLIGTLFSAIGIVLEGIGLLYYLSGRPSPKQQSDTERKRHSWTWIKPEKFFQKERFKENITQYLIVLGLIFQLLGLFV